MKREVAVSKPKSCKDLSLQQTVISVEYVRQPGDSKYWATMQKAPIKQSFQAGKCLRKAVHSAFGSFLTFRHGTARRCVYAVELCVCKQEYLRYSEKSIKRKEIREATRIFPQLVWKNSVFIRVKKETPGWVFRIFCVTFIIKSRKLTSGTKF